MQHLIYLWNIENRIFVFRWIGEYALLCQIQTTTKHDPKDIILLWNILAHTELLTVHI